jgi:hypothetical protein
MRRIEDLFRTIAAVAIVEDEQAQQGLVEPDDIESFDRIAPAVEDFLAEWKEGLSDVDAVAWLLLYQQQWLSRRGSWEL